MPDTHRTLWASFMLAMAMVGCSTVPVGTPDPAELNWPVHEPLVTADVVHVEILYLDEVEGVDKPIREAIERFARHLAGDVRVIELERSAVQYDAPAGEPPSEVDIQRTYEQVREHHLPSDVLIVVVQDWREAAPTVAGSYRTMLDGSHTVLLRANRLDRLAEQVSFISRNTAWRSVTQHELAHALGVPTTRDRLWANRHCVQPECLLYPWFEFKSVEARFVQRQPPDDLCELCVQELRTVREERGVVPRQVYADYDLLAYMNEMVALNPQQAHAYLHRLIIHGQLGNYAAEIADLERALELSPDEPAIIERLAWRLATLPQADLRDGERAVELARRGCELSDWDRLSMIGALAAAYAEIGDFDAAASLQKKVLQRTDANREVPRQRLQSYQASRPWRQPVR